MTTTPASPFTGWTALLLLLCVGCVCCLSSPSHHVRRATSMKRVTEKAANCSIPQANILECVFLTASDIPLLQQWLQTAQATFNPFVVLMRACDADALPSDIFAGYSISELTLELSGVTSVPWDTYLTSLGAAFTFLQFLDNNITTVTAPTTPPVFIDTLLSFDMPENGIESLADGAFDNYSLLGEIDLDNNLITSIGQHFRALYALQTLDLSSNRITTIADNAFEDLFFLESLELQGNQLTTLQQAAFNGLDYVPSINLIGNPFDCTCDLEWLKDWLNGKGILEKSGATCATPVNAPFADYDFCPTRVRQNL